jgi:hypothetical protein
MHCPHCYAATADVDFCLSCGKPLGPIAVIRPVRAAPGSSGWFLFFLLVGFLVIIVGAAFLFAVVLWSRGFIRF